MSKPFAGILIISMIALPVLPFAYACFLSWFNPHQLQRLIGTWFYYTATTRTVEKDRALESLPERVLGKNWLWATRIVLSIHAAVYLTIVVYLLVVII